ncbi:hypothetical protein ACET3Z_003082 [Daucus carota]
MVQAGVALVPPSLMLNKWHTETKTMEQNVKVYTQTKLPQEIISGVEEKAEMLSPFHISTTNLAKMLSPDVKNRNLSIPHIESKVSPLLFQAFSTIPYLSQVSYVQRDGLLFSYYKQGNQQPIAVYTNTSVTSAAKHNLTCYSQPANRDTGRLYGVVTSHSCSTLLNQSMLHSVLESTNGTAFVGPSWIDNDDLLFLNTAVVDGRGALFQLGFEVKAIAQSLFGSTRNDGSLFLGTKGGQVLTNAKIPNTRIVIVGNNSVAVKLLNHNGDEVGDVAGDITCQPNDGTIQPTPINILGTEYDFYCSTVEILGVDLVLVLAMQVQGPETSMHKNFNESHRYLIGTICAILIFTTVSVVFVVTASQRVSKLRAALEEQVAATAQEERKGNRRSSCYAEASHDVRASLAGIIGMVDICLTQVEPGSSLEGYIQGIQTCSQDLLGLLNNILNRSKLEAGKLTNEHEEFKMSQLLEDVADLFHVVGMKKGVDVVLDLSDGSVNKIDHVRGDRKQLKQILANLVSNAVKFTSEGYVCIRAYARKPTFSSSTPASTERGLSWLSCFGFAKTEAPTEYTTNVRDNDNCMEFVFEVDDTGAGIPQDKRETVFENYAQIKGTSAGQEGTGLGLGIVQSLVRLMGGEIEIVDKEVGKKGTCFKFNTYISVCETDQRNQSDDTGSHVSAYMSLRESFSPQGSSSELKEGSRVIFFIQNEERSRVCQRFMDRQGVESLIVRTCKELASSLKRMIGHVGVHSLSGSSKKSDGLQSLAGSDTSSPRLDEAQFSPAQIDQEIPSTHRTRIKESLLANFTVIIIDTTVGALSDLIGLVAEIRKNLSTGGHRIVWLDSSGFGNTRLQGLRDTLHATDIILSKPLHGSRLHQVLKLLPEYGGERPAEMSEAYPPNYASSGSLIASDSLVASPSSTSSPTPQTSEIREVDRPLAGKKVLVVEDAQVLQIIATAALSALGASFEVSNNGQEALEAVSKGLEDKKTSKSLPFDYIFMDCQMPVMDGIEATQKIRQEEAKYGVHIPIFAVSAYTEGPEIKLMEEAGVDYNLAKPLNIQKIKEALSIFEDQG